MRKEEETAIRELKNIISQKYPLVDFRLFGSKILGTDVPDSDIDIMIILEHYNPTIEEEIDNYIFDINLKYDCFISSVIFSNKEIEEGPLSESPLYKKVVNEGVVI